MKLFKFLIVLATMAILTACTVNEVKEGLLDIKDSLSGGVDEETEPASTVVRKPPPRTQSDNPPILQLDTGGHKSLIRDVVFTPDGKYLVSAGDDKVIRVWDIKTGKTVRTLRGQIGAGSEGKVFAMALSPDGQWLAVGGWMHPECAGRCGDIRLYDFASGQLVTLLKGHTNVVFSLAFSPDNRYLVSGSYDNNAIVWEIPLIPPLLKLSLTHKLNFPYKFREVKGYKEAKYQ